MVCISKSTRLQCTPVTKVSYVVNCGNQWLLTAMYFVCITVCKSSCFRNQFMSVFPTGVQIFAICTWARRKIGIKSQCCAYFQNSSSHAGVQSKPNRGSVQPEDRLIIHSLISLITLIVIDICACMHKHLDINLWSTYTDITMKACNAKGNRNQ